MMRHIVYKILMFIIPRQHFKDSPPPPNKHTHTKYLPIYVLDTLKLDIEERISMYFLH